MKKTILLIFSTLLLKIGLFANSNISGIEFKLENGYWVSIEQSFIAVLPKQRFEIELKSENINNLVLSKSAGVIDAYEPGKWFFIAPEESGSYQLSFVDSVTSKTFEMVLFVKVPVTQMKGEYLNKYRIGKYPDNSFKGKKNYKKPTGFIEVTEENKDLFITPHFQLKQFLCKQKSGWPKYVLLNPKLLIKLEYLLTELNKDGRNIKTLFIMSGYRTPFYNKSLGNVKFSRHVFGDAADIYVDENHDSVIDDLNHDGKHSMSDEMVIYKIVNSFDNDPKFKHLVGGMGKYNKNSRHTYFVHIDTRGYKARW